MTDNNTFRNPVLVLLLLGLLMSGLDIALIGPALPAIKNGFHINERAAAWLFTSYILLFLIATPIMAKLSDTYGRRWVYILDVFLFGAGSLVFALAPSFPILIAGRAVSGFGAGGIMPVANAVVGDMFPVEKRGTALGILQAVFGIALVLGPLLGGILLAFNWRLLFLINIPVAAYIIIKSLRAFPAEQRSTSGAFDVLGIALLAALLISLGYGINHVNTADFLNSVTSRAVMPYIILAVILFPFFIWQEKNSILPILPLRLFCSHQVTLVSLISFATGLCLSTFIFMPVMAVQILHFKLTTASFVMLPLIVSMSAVSIVAGKMLEWVSAKSEMIFGSVLITAGLFLLSSSLGSVSRFIAAGVIIGAGVAIVPIRFVMLSAVPSAERTVAQGLLSLNMSIGQMLGGVLLGALITSYGSSVEGYITGYRIMGYASISLFIIALGLKGGKMKDVEILICDHMGDRI